MLTHYLRFADRAAMLAALDALGWIGEGGAIARPANFRIDEIGPVQTAPAELDGDGEPTTPASVDARHHVNLYAVDDAVLPAGLSAYAIAAPATPVRIFGAG